MDSNGKAVSVGKYLSLSVYLPGPTYLPILKTLKCSSHSTPEYL